MTLIDCLKKLFKEDDINPLSPEELRVYIDILKSWNSTGREEWFECNLLPNVLPKPLPNVLPKMTIIRARAKLQKRGLIQYVSGNGKSKKPYFKIKADTNVVTNVVTNSVTNPKEEIPPTPPKEENNIYNNKETSSNEDVKKGKLSSHTSDRMDWGAFMQTFNDMLSPGVPKLISMNQSRRDKVKAVVKEYGKESIMQAFDKIRKSDFLMGRNRKPNDNWKCNFDFIFSKSGFIKILEGNYDNGVNKASYSEKRAANEEVFRQFIAEREQRASGMVVEVEKPF